MKIFLKKLLFSQKKHFLCLSFCFLVFAQTGFAQKKYTIRLQNVDDLATAYLNKQTVLTAKYGQTKELDITNLLVEGNNFIRFSLENNTGGIAYTFLILEDDKVIFKKSCGKSGVVGCEANKTFPKGIVRRFGYTLLYEKTPTNTDNEDTPDDNTTVVPDKNNPEGNTNNTISNATKSKALKDYQDNYLASKLDASDKWTGNVQNCDAGTTTQSLKDKTLQRLNYYRRLAGLSDNVTLNLDLSKKAQKGALMMKANNDLSHQPPTSWKCYTKEGADAAGSSNIALGASASYAIDLYIDDGTGSMGHRRWILYPPLSEIGTGDTDRSNVLYVFGSKRNPEFKNPAFVAFPPQGYVPSVLVFPTWSFSMEGADFSKTTATVVDGKGKNVPTTSYIPSQGYGLNAFCFNPEITDLKALEGEVAYTVTIKNITNAKKESVSHTYKVIIFKP